MKKYIIYGTDTTGEEVYYLMRRQGYEISGYIDPLRVGRQFHGFTILSPNVLIREMDKKKEKDFFIIVASNVNYSKIQQQLLDYELSEFDDFINYIYFFKKIAILNCNCYTKYYKAYLEANEEFSKEYIICPTPEIVCGINQTKLIKEGLLKRCDLFIHQDIQENNSIGYQYSDKYLLPKLNPECRRVTVPNLVGFGNCFFPQIKPEEQNGNRLFKKNIVIEDCFEKGLSLEEIVNTFKNKRYYDKEEIENSIQEMFRKLKEREENWDIKISDFLLEHLHKEQLFNNYLHATNIVLKKICDRLSAYLGYSATTIKVEVKLDWDEEFMLPYIIPELKEECENKQIRMYDKRLNILGNVYGRGLSLEEYIREYVWFKYGEML